MVLPFVLKQITEVIVLLERLSNSKLEQGIVAEIFSFSDCLFPTTF